MQDGVQARCSFFALACMDECVSHIRPARVPIEPAVTCFDRVECSSYHPPSEFHFHDAWCRCTPRDDLFAVKVSHPYESIVTRVVQRLTKRRELNAPAAGDNAHSISSSDDRRHLEPSLPKWLTGRTRRRSSDPSNSSGRSIASRGI